MNVSTSINKPQIELVNSADVPRGAVYSWGAKAISFLRVQGGNVRLSDFAFIPEGHEPFHPASKVQVAKADLRLTYEG